MDRFTRKLARESALQFHAAILKFIRDERELPPDEFYALLAELKCIYLQMIYLQWHPSRTD
jgi:hypothetical protein